MFYAPADPQARSDWGVVCTCREPTPLVLAFVAHHIGLGAREVFLYLDAPQPDLEAILAEIPQVRVQICDEAYWQSRKNQRPDAVEHRQLVNAYDAYGRAQVAWLAHFDADEFLHADMDVALLLNAQPPEVDYLLIEPRERAFVEGQAQLDLFDGVFRRPTPDAWGGARYFFEPAWRYLRRGVLGHSIGKSFMRTGQALTPGIHTPRRPVAERGKRLRGWSLLRARLLHFDGLTALHWTAKLRRAALAGADQRFLKGAGRDSHRARQIALMRRFSHRKRRALRMHDDLKVVPRDQLERLLALGLIDTHSIDPARDIAALNLSVEVDLSRAAFDRALVADNPDIADWLPDDVAPSTPTNRLLHAP